MPRSVPIRTPMHDPDGRLNRKWIEFFQQQGTADSTSTTTTGPGTGELASVSGSEIGTRYANPETRLEHLTVGIVPVLTGGYPRDVTYWISADDGDTFVWIGWQEITEADQVIQVDRLVPSADGIWRVAAAAGAIGGNPVAIAASELPEGAVISDSFAIAGIEVPAAGGVTAASVLDVEGMTAQIVTRTREDQTKYGEMGLVQWTDPVAAYGFFVRITVQELDITNTPLPDADGLERPFDGYQVAGDGGEVRKSHSLLITYKAGLAFVRVKIYLANRNSQGTWDFQDPATNTLQTCWAGGANHLSIPVPMVVISAVTGEEAGARYAAPETKLVHLFVDITPTLTAIDLPVNVTYWISADDGATYVWIGWELVTTLGQVIRVDRLAPVADQNWKVAVCAGTIGGNPVPILSGALPADSAISASFPVVAIQPPSSTLVPTINVSAGAGGTNPYNVVTPYREYWSIESVSYDDTPCLADPNAFFVRITAEDLDSSHNSVAAEKPFAGTQVSELGEVQTFGPLMGEYGSAGRSGNIHYVRLRLYVCNRIDQTSQSFLNPLAATLQPAATVDVLVGPAPAIAPATSDLFYTDVIVGGAITPDLANGQNHQVFLAGGSPLNVNNPIFTAGSIVAGLNLTLAVYQPAAGAEPDPAFDTEYTSTGGTAISADPLTVSIYYFRFDGANWDMIAFQPGLGAVVAAAAPNVSFSGTPIAVYDTVGNAESFGFSGTINLPTADPDYLRLKRIDVVATGPSAEIVPVCSLYREQFAGATIAFAGASITRPLAGVSWTLKAWAINDDNIASPSPASATVTVSAAGLTSVTGAEVAGAVYQGGDSSMHTVVALTPVAGTLPILVTLWLDFGKGEGWVWQGWWKITTAGQVIRIGDRTQSTEGAPYAGHIYVPTDTAYTSWKVAAAPGAVFKTVTPPAGYVQATFTVAAVGAAAVTDITNADFVLDPVTSNKLVYTKNSLGQDCWHIYELRWNHPSLNAANYFWHSVLTVQKGAVIASVWTPAPDLEGGTSHPGLYDGRKVGSYDSIQTGDPSTGMTVVWRGDPLTAWTYPPNRNADLTPNLYRTFRLKLYSVSRRGTDFDGGTGVITLNTCWPGGADHYDLTPGAQTATVDAGLTNPATLAANLSVIAGQLSVAPKGITEAFMGDQSVHALQMAANAVTLANGALSANTVVDANVIDVGVTKLIHGTRIFTGDVIFSRGSAQPVMALQNTGLFLYGVANGPGTAGLTSQPHVAIQSSGIAVLSSTTGPSVTINSSGVSIWMVHGNPASPYATFGAAAIQLVNSPFILDITPAQIKLHYNGVLNPKPSLTLTTLGAKTVYGTMAVFVGFASGTAVVQLWSTDGSTATPFIGMTTGQIYIGAANYLTTISASKIRMEYIGGASLELTSTQLEFVSGAYSLTASASSIILAHSSGSRLELTSTQVIMRPGAGVANVTLHSTGQAVFTTSFGNTTISGPFISASSLAIGAAGISGSGLDFFFLYTISWSASMPSFSATGGGIAPMNIAGFVTVKVGGANKLLAYYNP